MKPITHTTFKNEYRIHNPDALVKEDDELTLTEDLYIIRSNYKRKRYVGVTDDTPSGYDYEYIPSFKLMSRALSEMRERQGEYDVALAIWDDDYIWHFRHGYVEQYAKALVHGRYSDKRALFDGMYYMINPLQMRYNDGRLKAGFKNHLIRRYKGFAKKSKTSLKMLQELERECSVNYQDDLFHPELIIKMRNYLDNEIEIHQCPFTQEINSKHQMVQFRLSGISRYCQGTMTSDDVEAAGYSYDAGSHTFLLENEIMIDGTCYDSTTVNIVRCTGCNTRCVEEETRDGECVECCGRDYRIHNYTHRVEETLGFDRTTKLKTEPYLGIEMEFQVDNRRAGRLYVGDTMFGHALMKEDGSITNGFELVSRPAGYTSHLARYDSFLTDLPEYIHPHKSCGMHVHISRTAFTHLGAGKLVEFMNREDNKDFIKLIAGRGTTSYQNREDSYDIKTPYLQAVKDRYVGRYNFVNLNNKKTIELRIFATPANKQEFNIRMQFVKAMIEYCKPAMHTVSLKQQTHYQSFVNWLSTMSKDFKQLNNYIKESTICA